MENVKELFIESDISHMEKTTMSIASRINPIWQKAFKFYNDNNKSKLGMGCTPCYAKVLRFVKEKWEN